MVPIRRGGLRGVEDIPPWGVVGCRHGSRDVPHVGAVSRVHWSGRCLRRNKTSAGFTEPVHTLPYLFHVDCGITAIFTIGRTDPVDSILQMRKLRLGAVVMISCLSHLSFMPHREVVEPSGGSTVSRLTHYRNPITAA